MSAGAVVSDEPVSLSPRMRFQAGMLLAMVADALQIVVFPLFVEGGLSPLDDVLDFAVAGVLISLLGWHWEFLPSFFAELVPGANLVPFWTFAVLNVYRKWKREEVTAQGTRKQPPALSTSQPPS